MERAFENKQFAVKVAAETPAATIIYQVPCSCPGVANFTTPLPGTAHSCALDTTTTPATITINTCAFGAG